MKSKIISIVTIGLITSSLLASNKILIPLPAESLSVENSGIKQSIDAYQDGVGIYTLESLGANKVDNSEMNALVFKYGDVAKELNVSVKEYVQTNGTNQEKELASTVGKFEPMVPGNGTVCNDNNAQTINDIYTNGVCAGTNVEGQTCNDGNSLTYADKYASGVCSGKVPTSCNDLLTLSPGIASGTYSLDVDNNPATANVSLYCDMTTAGGGWTRIQVVNTSFYTSSTQYNWNMYTPVLNDQGLSYTKFMLKNTGTSMDWANTSSAWGSVGIDEQLLDVRMTDNSFYYLPGIKNTSLSDAGTLRPCLNDTTTTNTCHTIYVGNIPTGKRIKHFWDDEAKRATLGLTDYTNVNTINFKFDVYVK